VLAGDWQTVDDAPAVAHDCWGWLGSGFGSAAAIGAPANPAAIAAALNSVANRRVIDGSL